MKKAAKITGIVLGTLVALFLLADLALQLPWLPATARKAVAENVEGGRLDFASLKVSLLRHFPAVHISSDSLTLDMKGDPMLRLGSLNVQANPLGIIFGKIRIKQVEFRDMDLTIHRYADTLAVALEENDEVTDTSSFSLPEWMPEVDLVSLSVCGDSKVNFIDHVSGRGAISSPVSLDVSASAVPHSGLVNLKVPLFKAGVGDALSLELKADARDILSESPSVSLVSGGETDLATLTGLLSGLDLAADGHLYFGLDADIAGEELKDYIFRKSKFSGFVSSPGVKGRMDADSLSFRVGGPDIRLSASSDGADLEVRADSVFFRKSSDLKARARNLALDGKIFKVRKKSRMVPRMEAGIAGDRIFIKAGPHRIGMKDLDVDASLEKRLRRETAENIDTSAWKFGIEWNPAGSIHLGGAFISTPMLPLRTRVAAFDGSFNPRQIKLDTLAIKCGTSDISVKGTVDGVRRALLGKGKLAVSVDAHSRRINANELIVALTEGRSIKVEDTEEMESEHSFVKDSIDVQVDTVPAVPYIRVPGNLDASFKIVADKVDYSDVRIEPFRAYLKVADRTAQITRASAKTSVGDIGLSAFYSTPASSDISIGADLNLKNISAANIIHMLPTVDEMMPALKSFEGALGCNLTLTSKLDTAMNILIPTFDAVINISGRDLYVRDAGDLRRITKLLLFKDKNIGHIEDLNVNAVVHDGQVELFPFELGVDRYRLALSGVQNFDKTMSYHVSIMKAPFIIIPFGINMVGSLDKWKIRLGRAKYHNGKVPVYTEQIDEMRINVRESISDIFRRGVRGAMRSSRQYARKAVDSKAAADTLSAETLIGTAEYMQIDSLLTNYGKTD